MGTRDIEVFKVWDQEAIEASATVYSDAYDMGTYALGGAFSVQYTCTGAGASVTIGYLLSNDGTNFVKSTGGYTIVTDTDEDSGTDLDGKDLLVFSPDMGRFIKLYALETGGAAGITLTLYFAVQ